MLGPKTQCGLWDAIFVVGKGVQHDDAAKTQVQLVRFFRAVKARPASEVPANKLSRTKSIFLSPEEPL